MSEDQRYPYKSGRFGSHAVIERMMGPGTDRVALDVGCGGGFVAGALGRLGWTIDGIEADPELAEQARQHCRTVYAIDASRLLDLGSGQYDVVIFGDVLEHLVDPAPVLRSAKELLRPGGFVIVSVPNVAHAFVRASLLSGRFEYQERGILDRTHLRFFTRKTLRDFVRDCGYTIRAEVSTPAPVEEVWAPASAGGRAEFLQSVGAKVAQTMPTLFGYQFVVALRPVSTQS